jgi:hypothetical protein
VPFRSTIVIVAVICVLFSNFSAECPEKRISKGRTHNRMTSSVWTKLLVCLALLSAVCPSACAQSAGLQLYSDEQELRRALTDLPPAAPNTVVGTNPIKIYLNQAIGTEFNRPTSLTAIFCDRETAFSSIKDGVATVLTSAGFDVSSGWDEWGMLKATKLTNSTSRLDSEKPAIFRSPPKCEDITLKVKIDQKGLTDRALTLDYTVLAGPRIDRSSKTDMSSDAAVEQYMDSQFGSMRRAAEEAIKAHCTRIKVTDVRSEDEAVHKLVETLHLNATQEKDVRAALGDQK